MKLIFELSERRAKGSRAGASILHVGVWYVSLAFCAFRRIHGNHDGMNHAPFIWLVSWRVQPPLGMHWPDIQIFVVSRATRCFELHHR